MKRSRASHSDHDFLDERTGARVGRRWQDVRRRPRYRQRPGPHCRCRQAGRGGGRNLRRSHRPRRNQRGDSRRQRCQDSGHRRGRPAAAARFQRRPCAPDQRRRRARRRQPAPGGHGTGLRQAACRVRRDAAQGPLDPRRILGSRGLAEPLAPGSRPHRQRHSRQSGVRAASRRTHGPRQRRRHAPGRHQGRYRRSRRRDDRSRWEGPAHRDLQGQRDGHHHSRGPRRYARADHGQGEGGATARRLARCDNTAGHDGEPDRVARLPGAARSRPADRTNLFDSESWS